MEQLTADFYRLLFESAAEGMVITNANGEILIANPQLLHMFGYTEKELLGKQVEILIPESARHHHTNYRAQFAENPTKRSMGIGRDLLARKSDGTSFPIEVSLNHIRVNENLYFLGLITDISERKKIENQIQELNKNLEMKVLERTSALHESQELYALISRNFPKGSIRVLDDHLTCVFAEGEDLIVRGINPDNLHGQSYLISVPETFVHIVTQKLTEVLSGQKSVFDYVADHAHYQVSASPLFNKFGNISRILIVERDITEEKRYEAEMAKSLEKERELNELKSRFVSMASHEFRTPLSTILSSAGLAAKYVNPEDFDKRTKHLERIKSSVNHLTNILNDFLSLSKLEEGMVKVNTEAVDIEAYFTNFKHEMQEIAKAGQQITLHMQCRDKVVCFDPVMLKNTCLNLVSNAIKYSQEGQEIIIEVCCANGILKVTVKDSGIGIPEEEQKNMFERFFRAKNAINIQGTGLGLNILKKYIDIMNGTISFTSREHAVTTFTIEIPIIPCYEKNFAD
jgi:PAS domain S-box-containing protein